MTPLLTQCAETLRLAEQLGKMTWPERDAVYSRTFHQFTIPTASTLQKLAEILSEAEHKDPSCKGATI